MKVYKKPVNEDTPVSVSAACLLKNNEALIDSSPDKHEELKSKLKAEYNINVVATKIISKIDNIYMFETE